MTNYNDGKIHGWNGGECPVHPETVVMVWFRDEQGYVQKAGGFDWVVRDYENDIIAFQVVKEHREPKVVWVNEYVDGTMRFYSTEEAAKSHTQQDATRIAVKYQEVI